MRLSSIKLAGFKSFSDPATLPLPSNLTSVVGPNGCGKSNIIDAIRWLLGENSMRQLRSETMEDVIFNGSKTRKPAGRASVELLFDNSDGTIGGPYAAYNEIAVRRELTRDGDSQYYLNGAKCLKRDVTDLFLGTGLGGRSQYAIIEQGMVSRMIEAKPEELRQWLEEAAGISKYKERRRETETRIRQTRENLARLNDLRTELVTRLETLRKQATNAEKYREFKEQERKLKAELLALRWRALEAQCLAQDAAIGQLGQALDEAKARLAQAHDERAAAETAHQAENQSFNELQGKLYEAEAAKARQEQDLKHAREMRSQRVRELEQLSRQLEEITQRHQRETQRLTELSETLNHHEADARAAQAQEAEKQAALAAADDAALRSQGRWDEFITAAEGSLTQLEAERVRVQQLERAVRQAEERISSLKTELASLDAAPIQATLFEADTELKNLQREMGNAQAQLQSQDHQIQELRDQRATAEATLHEARHSLQDARGRLSSLETLQAAALRQDDADLNAWLGGLGLDGELRLASALQVEPGWETAVEHVLSELLQAPLTPKFAEIISAIAATPKSGAALLHNSPGIASHHPEDRLSHKTVGPGVVSELLHGVHIAETAAQAQARARDLPLGESAISKDGVWFGKDWVRYPRTDKDQTGVLARGALLKQLRKDAQAQAETVRTREQALEELTARAQELETHRRELASRFDEGRGRESQRLAFRHAQAVRLEQTQTRLHQLTQEQAALSAERGQQATELAQSRQRLAELEKTANRLREQRAGLQQALADARAAAQRARLDAQQASANNNRAQMQLVTQRSALESLRGVLEDLEQQRESRSRERLAQDRVLKSFDAPIDEQARHAGDAVSAVQLAQDALRKARERLTATETRLSQLAQQVQNAEFERDAAREHLQQAQIESQGLTVRRQTFSDQITETGLDRAELLQGLGEDTTPETWDEKLATMARRIDRLGPINLAAIQELEESQARETEMGRQHADISGALETLEEAIRKIDRETQERFKSTFDRVNAIFQERFPQLFGGGEAYLELTGDDLLNTGVSVMARPPGKRNSTIHLLSGGEKAMTAVALLLALFQLNPAPFCLMDEVDAPLDDANVGRFCEVVREMAQNVQFIIITHNKITMELAAHLHGVTMQEAGVSRLVSVNVQEAVRLTESGVDRGAENVEAKELA